MLFCLCIASRLRPQCQELSDRHIEIEVEPEDLDEGSETCELGLYMLPAPGVDHLVPVKLTLSVQYTPNYPDELPDLTLVADDGEINDAERDALLEDLRLVVRVSISILTPSSHDIYVGTREHWHRDDVYVGLLFG